MRSIYTILLYLLTPVFLLRLYIKSLRNTAYRQRINERFGFIPKHSQAVIWIHAVSLGESIAAEPLIRALLTRYPDKKILVTNMTPTGTQRIRQQFPAQVLNFYMPYDIPFAIKRFLKRVQPEIVIYMETEIWPNLYYYVRKLNSIQVIANARLSARSAQAYARLARLMRLTLGCLDAVCAQTQADAERFISLGVPQARIQVTGNLKFELQLPADLSSRAQALKQTWGRQRLVLMAGSTHPGEDEIVLQAFSEIRRSHPHALLLLIPRHPERASSLLRLCHQYDFKPQLRSAQAHSQQTMDVLVGDTIGEMLLFYRCSDVAFVGGSLIEHGGQNVLEPAALGVPIITGPHLHNFADICAALEARKALKIVVDSQGLASTINELLNDRALMVQMSCSARLFIDQQQGAVAKTVACLEQFL